MKPSYFIDPVAALEELVWVVRTYGGTWHIHQYQGRFVVAPEHYRSYRKRPPMAVKGI